VETHVCVNVVSTALFALNREPFPKITLRGRIAFEGNLIIEIYLMHILTKLRDIKFVLSY